ncbi:MAG: NADAR family protein [Candidatus Doudnabacteria bacterium]|nr:NADAR family protein [Candidatus Doudnabacteria bacterium]
MPPTPPFDRRQITGGDVEFFYDHTHPFANVFSSTINYGGSEYRSAEQAYQSMKFNPEQDAHILEAIMQATEAGQAKVISRTFSAHIRPGWNDIKFRIMIKIVLAKMEQHPEIAERLLNTGNRVLVEDAPDDPCWGMVTNEVGVVSGSNYMGRVLMFVRYILQKREKVAEV